MTGGGRIPIRVLIDSAFEVTGAPTSNLPMTKATFVEDALMAGMVLAMLLGLWAYVGHQSVVQS